MWKKSRSQFQWNWFGNNRVFLSSTYTLDGQEKHRKRGKEDQRNDTAFLEANEEVFESPPGRNFSSWRRSSGKLRSRYGAEEKSFHPDARSPGIDTVFSSRRKIAFQSSSGATQVAQGLLICNQFFQKWRRRVSVERSEATKEVHQQA